MAFARSFNRKSIASFPSTAPRFTPRPRSSAGAGAGTPELGLPHFVGSAGFSRQAVDDYLGSRVREISLHSIGVDGGGHTVRPKGTTVNGNPISLLLSTGSTASFVHSRVADEFKSNCVPAAHMKVTLAGGKSITSCTTCLDVKWEMGGDSFCTNLRCLDLGDIDIDIILGTDWLIGYSPISFDFATITSKGKRIVLTSK